MDARVLCKLCRDLGRRELQGGEAAEEGAPGCPHHPKNPDVVYFFVEEYLFAVNMHTKVVEGEVHMVGASRVLAWELPPALTAGI